MQTPLIESSKLLAISLQKGKSTQLEADIANAEAALKKALQELHNDTSPFLIPYYYNYASILITKLKESDQLFSNEVVTTMDKVSEQMVSEKEEEKEKDGVLPCAQKNENEEAEDNDDEIVWQHLEAARVIAETEKAKVSPESNDFKSYQEWLALIHEKEGELYYSNENYQQAIEELKKSEEFREKLGNSLDQAKVCYNLGLYQEEFNCKEDAIKSCQKAITLTQQYISKKRGVQLESTANIQFLPGEEDASKTIQNANQLIEDIKTDLTQTEEIISICKSTEQDKFGERKLNCETKDLGVLSKGQVSNI